MTRTADYTPAGRNYTAMGFHTDGPLKNTQDSFVFSTPSNIVKSSMQNAAALSSEVCLICMVSQNSKLASGLKELQLNQ